MISRNREDSHADVQLSPVFVRLPGTFAADWSAIEGAIQAYKKYHSRQ